MREMLGAQEFLFDNTQREIEKNEKNGENIRAISIKEIKEEYLGDSIPKSELSDINKLQTTNQAKIPKF